MGARTDRANDLGGVLSRTELPVVPAPPAPAVMAPPHGARAAFDSNQFGAVLRRALVGI